MTKSKEYIFRGLVDRFVYEDSKTGLRKYQILASKFKGKKTNAKGLLNIQGDMPLLKLHESYVFHATRDKHPIYGYYYICHEVEMHVPGSRDDVLYALKEVTSDKRAEAIINTYPDFLDKVLDGEKIDPTPIYNVGEKTLSYIVEKLEEKFLIMAAYRALEGLFTFQIVEKLTNQYGGVHIIKEKLRQAPYKALCGLRGIGFLRADEIIKDAFLRRPETEILPKDVLVSKDRLLFAAKYFLDKEMFAKGHTYFNKKVLIRWLKEEAGSPSDELIDEVIHDELFVLGRGDINITTKDMFEKERYIYDSLMQATLTRKRFRISNLEDYRDAGDFMLSDNQLEIIKSAFDNKVTILNGYAGTGKTSAIKMLVKALTDAGRTYVLAAPTGKAAKVLSGYTDSYASTIHVALQCGGINDETGEVYFQKNAENTLKASMVIIDEASMMDTNLLYYLLQAIDFNYTHLLLIGDDAQLPSVGPGNGFSVLLNSGRIPKISLTEVHRFKEGGIATAATEMRLGTLSLDGDTTLGTDKSYVFKETSSQDTMNAILSAYERLLEALVPQDDILVLTYKKAAHDPLSTHSINLKMQDRFNPGGSVVENSNGKFRIGDIIMQTKNNYQAVIVPKDDYEELCCDPCAAVALRKSEKKTFVPNGATGRVKLEVPSGMIVEIDEHYIYIATSEYIDVELAYAITIHKSQGSQASHVIIISPKEHTYGMTSNLLYVATTRAKTNCYHFGASSTINRATTFREHVERKTSLGNMFYLNR